MYLPGYPVPLEYAIRPVTYHNKAAVIDIFNYYVENTYSAYPQNKVSYEFFDVLMDMAKGYPFYVAKTNAEEAGETSGTRKRTPKKVIGYAFLRPHYRIDTFDGAAELTCFIAPGYTGNGIGRALLDRLVADARNRGINTILASISSANQASIDFHTKYGFSKCGEFKGIGKKNGKAFDEVWMQLLIK
jgi:phosphinothricin acetyltransferase